MSSHINKFSYNKKDKYQNKSLQKEIENRNNNQSPKSIYNKMTNNHININNYNIISNLTRESILKNKGKLVSNNKKVLVNDQNTSHIGYDKKKNPVVLEIDSEVIQNSNINICKKRDEGTVTIRRNMKISKPHHTSSSSLIVIDKEKDNTTSINDNIKDKTKKSKISYDNKKDSILIKEDVNRYDEGMSRNKLNRYHSISNIGHNINKNNTSLLSNYNNEEYVRREDKKDNNDCIVFTRLETKINIINNIITQLKNLRNVLSEEEDEGNLSKTILKRNLNLEQISYNFIEFSKELLNFQLNNNKKQNDQSK